MNLVFGLYKKSLSVHQTDRAGNRVAPRFEFRKNLFLWIVCAFLCFAVVNIPDAVHSDDILAQGETLDNASGTDGAYPQSQVPAPLVDPGDFIILVEKATQKLYLYDGSYNLLKTFHVTTGRNSGDKRGRGDQKTPEGVYFFTLVKEDRELLPEYGIMALPINYPNYIDIRERKKGNGIWLHATDQPTRPLKPYDTRGCVVAANEDVLELAQYIKLQTTPIVITETIAYDTLEKIATTRREVHELLEQWRTSWEQEDINDYMQGYSKSFKANGMDWSGWKSYKEKLNHQYAHITISLSDIRILRHNGHVIVSFAQHYKNNRITSSGIKRLYLVHEDAGWKILGEEWAPFPAQEPARIAKKYAPPGTNGRATAEIIKQESVSVKKASLDTQAQEAVSLKAPLVDIEEFALREEKGMRIVSFKLVNKTAEHYKISGRIAIVASDDANAIHYASYPAMMLEQDAPKDFRAGEWFSIRRFKIVQGQVGKEEVKRVTIFVYSKTGEPLLQKHFSVGK